MTKFDLDFAGGTPKELVAAIQEAMAEGPVAGRRDALLGETLRLVRNRRRFRQGRRGAYALALVAVGLLVFRRQEPPPEAGPKPTKPYLLVSTQPLAKAAWVESQPLSAASLISSVPTTGIVTTAGAGEPWHEVNDEDLLALAAPNPVVSRRAEQLETENSSLRREVDYLRQQRDILKKTLGILSETPTSAFNGSTR